MPSTQAMYSMRFPPTLVESCALAERVAALKVRHAFEERCMFCMGEAHAFSWGCGMHGINSAALTFGIHLRS